MVLIFCALFGGGSYSKYLTQVEGKSVIQVAKWAFLVNGQTASITNIDLAKTYNADTLVENTIAPGTSGSFDIEIDATGSEVGINYEVSFANEKNKPQNLQFTYEGNTVNFVKELEQFLSGTIAANSEQKKKLITIYWEWPYETGETEEEKKIQNEEDTEDGKTLAEYQFDVIVTGKQVEPTR